MRTWTCGYLPRSLVYMDVRLSATLARVHHSVYRMCVRVCVCVCGWVGGPEVLSKEATRRLAPYSIGIAHRHRWRCVPAYEQRGLYIITYHTTWALRRKRSRVRGVRPVLSGACESLLIGLALSYDGRSYRVSYTRFVLGYRTRVCFWRCAGQRCAPSRAHATCRHACRPATRLGATAPATQHQQHQP